MNGKYKKYVSFTTIFLTIILFIIIYLLTSYLTTINASGKSNFPSKQYDNIALGKPYIVEPKPNYLLCTDDDDSVQLTDGIYMNGKIWTQKGTVGWQSARPVIITIDLGKVEPICGVSYNTAAGIAGVKTPVSISVLVSNDGTKYQHLGDLLSMNSQEEYSSINGYRVIRYWTDKLKAHGRFVQLVIDPGGNSFYNFTDEIEVFRGKPDWPASTVQGKEFTDAHEFFKYKTTNDEVRSRLYLDLEKAKKAVSESNLNYKYITSLLSELSVLEAEISNLSPVDPASFRAVLPINNLEARIFAIHGKLERLKGKPPLQAWVSHPYDFLSPTQGPDENSRQSVAVPMMLGEWRYFVVNVTNSTELPIKSHVSVQGLPGGINPEYITGFQVEWSDTKENIPIAAALVTPERDSEGYVITIPAGMTRQIWFSLHPQNVIAGDYSGQVIITHSGNNKLGVPFTLQLFPMSFPERPSLHLGGWDYTDGIRYGVTEANRNLIAAHLQKRFVDSPWASSSVLGVGTFDAEGNMSNPSTQRFDSWVKLWPNARRYNVFVSARDTFAGARIETKEFSKMVKSWIDFWVDHAKSKGVAPEQLVLLLVDEPKSLQQEKIIIAWGRAIRAAQPQVMLWQDITYKNPEQAMTEMLGTVDILCPNRRHILEGGKEIEELYQKQQVAGRRIDIYSTRGPMEILDPYSYVRLQAWTGWVMGAEGINFWSFTDTGGGNLWQPATLRNNYSPIFIAPDSVTAGKHMEAMRESVEDYEYFVMLRQALLTNPNSPAAFRAKELLTEGARRVLDAPGANQMSWKEPKDRWFAEKIRLEVLQTIKELKGL